MLSLCCGSILHPYRLTSHNGKRLHKAMENLALLIRLAFGVAISNLCSKWNSSLYPLGRKQEVLKL